MPLPPSGSSNSGALRKSQSVSSRSSRPRSLIGRSTKKAPRPAPAELEPSVHSQELETSIKADGDGDDSHLRTPSTTADESRILVTTPKNNQREDILKQPHTFVPVPESLQPFLDDFQDSSEVQESQSKQALVKVIRAKEQEQPRSDILNDQHSPRGQLLLLSGPAQSHHESPDLTVARVGPNEDHKSSSLHQSASEGPHLHREPPRHYQPYPPPHFLRPPEGPPVWHHSVRPSPILQPSLPIMQSSSGAHNQFSSSFAPRFTDRSHAPARSGSSTMERQGSSHSLESHDQAITSDEQNPPTGMFLPFSVPPPPPPPPPLSGNGNQLLVRFQHTMDNVARLSAALPDMQALMIEHQHAERELVLREHTIKQLEVRQQEVLKQKEQHIEMLVKELEDTKTHGAQEASKHRFEMSNLEEKLRELTESHTTIVESLEKIKDEHERWKRKQLMDSAKRETLYREKARADIESIEERYHEDKRRHIEQSEKAKEEFMTAYNDRLEAQEKAHEEHVLELRRTWSTDKEALRQELKAQFDAKTHAIELATQEERSNTAASRQRELEQLRSEHTEATKKAIAQTSQIFERRQVQWEHEKTTLLQHVDSLGALVKGLEVAKKSLKEFVELSPDIPTDSKPKGDVFYLNAFRGIQKQIISFAEQEFRTMPSTNEKARTETATSAGSLPNFMGGSASATQIRQAYVQHIVSRVLCDRIFHPFIFTLDRKDDKANVFLLKTSGELRSKSAKKEAAWRQQTLLTAYTSPEAQKATNFAAGTAVDEMLHLLAPMYEKSRADSIAMTLKQIVKSVGETWRYARLEREMFVAYMTTDQKAQERYRNWTEHSRSHEPFKGHPILCTIPCIMREPGEEGTGSAKPKTCGQVFLEGTSLYAHTPFVEERKRELHIPLEGPQVLPVGIAMNDTAIVAKSLASPHLDEPVNSSGRIESINKKHLKKESDLPKVYDTTKVDEDENGLYGDNVSWSRSMSPSTDSDSFFGKSPERPITQDTASPHRTVASAYDALERQSHALTGEAERQSRWERTDWSPRSQSLTRTSSRKGARERSLTPP